MGSQLGREPDPMKIIAIVSGLTIISLMSVVNAQTTEQLAKGKELICIGYTPEACKEMLASPKPPKNPYDLVERCQIYHSIKDFNSCDQSTFVTNFDQLMNREKMCIVGYQPGWEMCANADLKLNGHTSGTPSLTQKNSPIIYTTLGWEACENAVWPANIVGECYWEKEIHQKYLRLLHEYLEDYVK